MKSVKPIYEAASQCALPGGAEREAPSPGDYGTGSSKKLSKITS